ncbi:manganese-dependent inorganic pyrophosphatase [Cypionkella sp.]|uniref:manganese-dependent inorganic pyrophosphatase n=1 Tax=Cypionkella sp. TaxID=2811411 RepID=UPI00271CC88C|nr:manganese-dependent inorganic pyrophosphatase [Cypionkella sp.]MDO8985692.1 manganese-dependent inorganic pyrophosphatase [Cypionkella sp.]MDP1577111.1 manganese-dependent inorganic pyrophosphatase [Cypionkella sp.]MDP2049266.1 manganese-dependent inorganic pyrophosphatase [Cypionkella sp.]
MTTLVFGHKSPDTDSTGSPLIWAWYLSEMRNTPAKAVLLGTPNTEAAFMLKYWGFAQPEIIADVTADDKVVIVDTNNPAELPPSINTAKIQAIIDHHMLVGGLKTNTPIDITIRPLACTATIMHDLIGSDLARAPREIKGAMLTCILSDTMEFRSPTTTPHDRAVAEALAADLRVSIPEFAAEMFAAKSDVSAFSETALLRMDSKEYNIAGKELRISVLETTSPATVLARKAALMAAMPGVAAEDGAEQVLLFVIDILNEEATLLVPNDLVRQMAEASFGVTVTGDTVVIPGLMSRKKQIIPALKL